MKEPIKTLIIGYVPLQENEVAKPRDARNHKYLGELLDAYDLGEVHFSGREHYGLALDSVNPFIVIVFDEWTAGEVKKIKKDVFIYVTDAPSSIFSRKAESDAKQEKQRGIFEEIVGLVKKIRDEDEEQQEITRKVAAMSYNDTYKMIKQMIVSDNKDWNRQAWELLNDNHGRSSFVWMRAQILCDVWEGGDAKGHEEFLCMAMEQHVDNGLAHELPNFTDLDGQVFRQFMFHYVDGSDANYIRRIPVAQKGQDKYIYDSFLLRYETPNGVRMLFEAGQMKSEKETWMKNEAKKLLAVLMNWQADPSKSKLELGVRAAFRDAEHDPLRDWEVRRLMDMLRHYDPEVFIEHFPEIAPK